MRRTGPLSRLLLLAGLAALVAGIAGVASIYQGEFVVERYATRAEAEAAGAFRRGWLPTFLPASAVELNESHDLDTNERWLSFRADTTELRTLVARLETLPYLDARASASRRPWRAGRDWPPELDRAMLATPRSTTQLSYHISPSERYCLAVHWRSGYAYGWSCEVRAVRSAAS